MFSQQSGGKSELVAEYVGTYLPRHSMHVCADIPGGTGRQGFHLNVLIFIFRLFFVHLRSIIGPPYVPASNGFEEEPGWQLQVAYLIRGKAGGIIPWKMDSN